jgi:hypothetical protein
MGREMVNRSILVTAVCVVLACFSSTAWADNVIHGSAQNLSRNQPAADDEAILICLNAAVNDQHEIEARIKTDAQGAFTFHVQHPDKPYLVRVVHQGVPYDQQASAGDNLSMRVFDAAPRLAGIAGSIEILRVGTSSVGNEKFLHVSDMYEIRNDSNPPMTQAGARTFDVYLPADARIDTVLAAAPSAAESLGHGGGQSASGGQSQGRIGVMISAIPIAGEPGHYAVNFSLRPGATKFAFNYDLPYQGRAKFLTKHGYGFQQMAVMIPPTMKFSSASSAFQKLPTGGNEYQVEAATRVKVGEGPAFEISGSGPLPPLQAKTQAQPQSSVLASSTAPAPAPTHAQANSAPKLDNATASWPWLALLGAGLLVSAFAVLRIRNSHVGAAAVRARTDRQTNAPADFLQSLKEELFQLEADHLRGSISVKEYASYRQALEETFKRVVARESEDRTAPATNIPRPLHGGVPQPASPTR